MNRIRSCHPLSIIGGPAVMLGLMSMLVPVGYYVDRKVEFEVLHVMEHTIPPDVIRRGAPSPPIMFEASRSEQTESSDEAIPIALVLSGTTIELHVPTSGMDTVAVRYDFGQLEQLLQGLTKSPGGWHSKTRYSRYVELKVHPQTLHGDYIAIVDAIHRAGIDRVFVTPYLEPFSSIGLERMGLQFAIMCGTEVGVSRKARMNFEPDIIPPLVAAIVDFLNP